MTQPNQFFGTNFPGTSTSMGPPSTMPTFPNNDNNRHRRRAFHNNTNNKNDIGTKTTILVFGASGDLACTKIYPALWRLWQAHSFPRNSTQIYGLARTRLSQEEHRTLLRRYLAEYSSSKTTPTPKQNASSPSNVNDSPSKIPGTNRLLLCLDYAGTISSNADFKTPLDGDDCDPFLTDCCHYQTVSDYGDTLALNRIFHQQQQKACTHYVHKDDYNSHQQRHNVLVYMALPSQLFGVAAQAVQTAMHNAGIVVQHQPKGAAAVAFVRLILEKPFGRDTSSCLELMKTLQQQQNWKECDLYRIDHYLGKESVRNILPLRRHLLQQQQTVHPALKPKINWNRHGIAAVHLVSHEPFGIDGRGGYFDSYGIIRDMIQNHLLQILTLIGMDLLPDNVDDDDDDWVRSSKVNVLKQIPIIQSSDCLLGQYNGYVNDDSIANTSSRTSTYACLRAWIDNDSWKGVPFVLEAGKALDEKLCEARIYLRNDGASMSSRDRMLVIRIQPSPSVQIITTPCYDGTAAGRRIDSYPTQSLSASSIVEGTEYAKLILDAIRGRRAHFVRNDELLEAWRIFTPLLHELDEADSTLHTPERYEPSSSGPVGRLAFLRAMGIPLDVPSRSAL